MNPFSPGEAPSRSGGKRKGKATSLPTHPDPSAVWPVNRSQHQIPWSQSAVNLMAPPPMDYCPEYLPYTLSQPLQHQPSDVAVQQHNWASTASLPIVSPSPVSKYAISDSFQNLDSRDVVGEQLSQIISLIDEETYLDTSREVVISIPETPPPSYSQSRSLSPIKEYSSERRLGRNAKPTRTDHYTQNRSVNVLTKLSYYSNSRLPATLPPLRVYISTYPLFCLAALCSANAYQCRPSATQDEQLVAANARIGTKAMVIKSVTCNDEKTIVFAIRGTSVLSLRDWNVNLNTTPQSPAGFLDDDGNYCHSGFLQVAKAMVKPVAARLRYLLEENPNRLNYSLLITGHSAGGAVASLLYTHMLSEHVRSELTILTDCFKRVHCVTFGAPPVSLLPLQKPLNKAHKLQKCLFHSFINEGDPVVRAEKRYIMSLVDLLTTSPASASSLLAGSNTSQLTSAHPKPTSLSATSMALLKITNLGVLTGQKKQKPRSNSLPLPSRPHLATRPIWDVPPGTLSNAGRLVVLRGPDPPPKASMSQVDLTKEFEGVRAYTVTDEEIRKVIFGDPLMHAMDVYRRRIEALAMKAVTGRDKFY